MKKKLVHLHKGIPLSNKKEQSINICHNVNQSQKKWKKKKNAKSYINMGFPGSSAWKNPPANVGDIGLIPGLRDLTCCGATKPVCCNYWVCALGPGICNYWACARQLLKPMCLESMLHNKRIHSIEKPEHCKWRAAPTCYN